MDMERQDDHHHHNHEEDGPGEVVKWERLTVLLVEPDDSTRQIIAALLRKCSYRGHFFCLSDSVTLLSVSFS